MGLTWLSRAQKLPNISATPNHFRWSEREAHELDYEHTIRTSPDLSSVDKTQLTNAVLSRLKLDNAELLDDLTEVQLRNLVADTRIELVDLNGDGKPEIIAQANGLGPCGGTGNCIFWIFQRTATGLKVILDTEDRSQVTFEKILVRPWSTNGYKDIVLGSHSNASSRGLTWFQYEDGIYRIHACYYLTWEGNDLQPLKSPMIWREKCSQLLGSVR